MAEVAGLTLGVVSLFANMAHTYASLLNLDFRSSGDRFDVLRIQILTQRSRLEVIGRGLGSLKSYPFPNVEELVIEILRRLKIEFIKLELFEETFGPLKIGPGSPTKPRRTYSQKLRLGLVELDRLKESLTNITSLIDSLEVLIPKQQVIVPEVDVSYSEQGLGSKRPEDIAESSLEQHDQKKDQTKSTEANQLFRSLVSICEQTLRLISSTSEVLKEAFLSYRLWTYTLENVNGFALFQDLPAQITEHLGPDIIKVQYQALAHLAWTLSQASEAFDLNSYPSGPETVEQLYVILNSAHDAGIDDEHFEFSDFENIYNNVKAIQNFTAEESELLIGSLLDSLPTLLHIAKSQQLQSIPGAWVAVPNSPELKNGQPTLTKELLEVTVELAEEIKKTFDEMSANGKASVDIPVERALKDLYTKETEKLRKWKEENGSKMNGKLTPLNKSVWEAIEVTLFNMTDLLNHMSSYAKSTEAADSRLNSKADKLLADYASINPQLKLNVELSRDDDLNFAIRGFGDFVQSLVNLEVPLSLIEPPPTYKERFRDLMVLDIASRT